MSDNNKCDQNKCDQTNCDLNNCDQNNCDSNKCDNKEFNLNDLDNMDFNNINTDEINKLLQNLGNGENSLNSIINNFSKGDMGSIFQNLGNIMSNDSKIDEDDTTEELDVNENNLSDDCDDEIELNLDKFFISSTGKNICDVLLEVKSELQNINETVKKTLQKN